VFKVLDITSRNSSRCYF